MGRVVDLWAAGIVEALRGSGSVVKSTEGLDVDRWRRAARQAGSQLGWSMQTGVSADGSTVWAVSPDYQPTVFDQAAAPGLIGDALYG
jgi:hypothetical protein